MNKKEFDTLMKYWSNWMLNHSFYGALPVSTPYRYYKG